jgi:CheY-like chemotaxis protein
VKSGNILYADCSPERRTLIASALEELGHSVVQVVNGAELLRAARKDSFDLLLVAVTDSLVQQTCIELRRENPKIPLVCICDSKQKEELSQMEELTMVEIADSEDLYKIFRSFVKVLRRVQNRTVS